MGGDAFAVRGDVGEESDVVAMFAAVDAHFGRLDALVNNAGTAVFKPILETTPEEWSRVLAVKFRAAKV